MFRQAYASVQSSQYFTQATGVRVPLDKEPDPWLSEWLGMQIFNLNVNECCKSLFTCFGLNLICLFIIAGHASFIGAKTGKLIGYEVRCKKCAICDAAARLNIEVRQHDCRKNWSGSAKAMEPDLAVSMLKTFKDKDASIKTITMDDDSTTIA